MFSIFLPFLPLYSSSSLLFLFHSSSSSSTTLLPRVPSGRPLYTCSPANTRARWPPTNHAQWSPLYLRHPRRHSTDGSRVDAIGCHSTHTTRATTHLRMTARRMAARLATFSLQSPDLNLPCPHGHMRKLPHNFISNTWQRNKLYHK